MNGEFVCMHFLSLSCFNRLSLSFRTASGISMLHLFLSLFFSNNMFIIVIILTTHRFIFNDVIIKRFHFFSFHPFFGCLTRIFDEIIGLIRSLLKCIVYLKQQQQPTIKATINGKLHFVYEIFLSSFFFKHVYGWNTWFNRFIEDWTRKLDKRSN